MKDGPDEGLSPLAKSYRAAAPWVGAVWQFVGSTGLMVAAGYAADRWLGSTPFGLIAGGLLGGAVGFYAFIRTTNRLFEAGKKK